MPSSPFASLPIDSALPRIKHALAAGSAVLAAPPGSGKTTIVPLALLDEPWLANRKIILLEPRRLAARAAASRMAALLGERLGQRVGYQIRFDRCISPQTRIEVVTEGILTRRLQHDAALADVGLVIFDEFHERSLHADLALALCLDLCQLRDDLRLLVMSATLETEAIARLLGEAPVVVAEGAEHQVGIDYLQRPPRGRIGAITAQGILQALPRQQGDMLAFLPGAGEIRDALHLLAGDPSCRDLLILPLFGDLPQKEQDRALLADPQGRRRIILATSIAETSLTIEGVGCVVDSGWSRRPTFDPGSGLSRLTTVRVSRASARQRAGRAGRLGPGHCLRLWTREEHHSLPAFHPPEIVHADLAPLALELALWGVFDAGELRWLDQPRSGALQQARLLLRALEAIDESGRVTSLGRQMAGLPLHPRLGRMLLIARENGQGALACDLAALLSERDLLPRDHPQASADLGVRLTLLAQWRDKGERAAREGGIDPQRCRRIDQAAGQWRQLLGCPPTGHDPLAVAALLVHAYPECIARRRPGQRGRYQLANGRGVLLDPADPLATNEYLVVPHVDAGSREGKIFLAEGVEIADIREQHRQLLTTEQRVCWDTASARVMAVRQVRVGAIIVEESPLADIDPEAGRAALMEGIARMGSGCLPWDRESRQLQARIHSVRAWQPQAGWPEVSDEALFRDLGWLEPYLNGITRADQLTRINLKGILASMLGWEGQQRLARLAPETFTAPSGSRIRIDYRLDGPPILAVRIQEMFGQSKTPTVCDGQLALVLHLLSPARRPIQVTTDLAGFWRRGYTEVKKELKGRYPKHFWPDDPLVAEATRGGKRRNQPG
ncbi:ATP-dependent helicase HrpB [Desulfobulbus propionicus DSM 2032]|uniref:ATP-dependent helicase HrpB n=1 Tax=Desulfobulbus propionicus (strain ATCC 33891 / DSM 2032 / VKM B-1956 / 1pr3) TaxID=577650 RepID=A0A7U3YLU1_DESPD|nr:ATP-dependent helicase HrpB [Desulfobulbus propionicus]ADW17740.1 ATP-dependent helicase HrpB [Desulfobulbus propionicus DSM 2032]